MKNNKVDSSTLIGLYAIGVVVLSIGVGTMAGFSASLITLGLLFILGVVLIVVHE